MATSTKKTKRCPKCGRRRSRERYTQNKRSGDGLSTYCRECSAKKRREYYRKAPEKHQERVRRWNQENPEKLRLFTQRRRARRAGAEGRHTNQEWLALCARYGNKCLRCGAKSIHLTKDHVVPLILGGTDSIENIQPLCVVCNSKKGSRDVDYRRGPVTNEPPHSPRHSTPQRRVTMREAADILGVSKEAVRKRVIRGTLPSDTGEDGRRYVYLDVGGDAQPQSEPAALISEMRDRIRFLEEEMQRKDAILLNMTEAMRALNVPERESPETEEGEPGTPRKWWEFWR